MKFDWKVYPLAALLVGVLVMLSMGEREFPCERCAGMMTIKRSLHVDASGFVIGTRIDYKCRACGVEGYEIVPPSLVGQLP